MNGLGAGKAEWCFTMSFHRSERRRGVRTFTVTAERRPAPVGVAEAISSW